MAERPKLAPWRDAPETAGVLTDFDGTLSAIVDDPEAAVALPGATETLTRLAGRYRTVAVISGRPVAYLMDRLALASGAGVTLIGLYGLETATGQSVSTLPEARPWRDVVAQVADTAEAEAPPGVYVERKGLTVALHVRRAPEWADWVEAWTAEQARSHGLVVHAAKMSRELVPPVATDKGLVVARMARGLEAVCFLGDDLGDVAAFAALDRLAATGVRTLKVAVRSPECPPILLATADIVVEGPAGALALLTDLEAS